MARTDEFLNNLIGVHDVQVNGGSLLPRRYTLNFVGGKVEDVGGVTQVTLAIEPVWLATDTLASNQDDYNPTGFSAATDVPVDMAADRDITGFVIAGTAVVEKRIWNLDTAQSLTIKHNDSGSAAANRVFNPGGADIVLGPEEVASIVYNPISVHWKGRKCLV